MSRSKPNWSDIDPYSSLEEASSSDTIILETDKDVGSKSENVDEIRYELREHKNSRKSQKCERENWKRNQLQGVI